MRAAGIPFEGLAAAFADDAQPREEIIDLAAARCRSAAGAGCGPFEPVTYVGDGVWDLRASEALGIGFLGIASGERAEILRGNGAVDVLPDFSDGRRVMEVLARS